MTFIHINDRLSYGGLSTCSHTSNPETAVIHACKEPCHRHAAGYHTKSLPPSHPNYLACTKPGNLYLNLIDPPAPLFQISSFKTALSFFDKLPPGKPLHIHCNQGQSRAPSIALLIMAKRMAALPGESYQAARHAFECRHPYQPGRGIQTFLTQNWINL